MSTSHRTTSGMQQKEGTNFDGPKPVEVAVAPAVGGANGGFAAMAARIAAANQDAAAAGKPAALAMAPAAVRRAAAQQAYVTPAAAASAAATAAATAAPQRLTSVDAPGLSIVVLDSGAFLSSGSALLHGTSAGFELLARLYREGNSEVRFVTIAAVIAELKDEKTRAMMAALPFQIEVLDVHPDAVREVIRFAQLTGDAKTLSAADIQVIALAYQLEKQYNGMHFLKSEPRRGKAMDAAVAAAAHGTAAAATAASRAAAQGASAAASAAAPAAAAPQAETPAESAAPAAAAAADSAAPAEAEEPQHEEHETDDEEEEDAASAAAAAPAAAADADGAAPAASSESKEADATDDNDGEGAWITPANLHKQPRPLAAPAAPESSIACITTDYAMQNVLLQLGARLLNLRGRSIRSIRTWMKKCHACDALSTQMDREFCERCGNHTMLRVNVTVNAAGLVRFWHGTRHLNLRGTVYSIPMPRAGRHANNLKLSEDVVDERIRKGGFAGAARGPRGEGKSAAQMFQDSIEFGLGRTGPNTNEATFGYGRKNPNAHSGHAQKKKKGKK